MTVKASDNQKLISIFKSGSEGAKEELIRNNTPLVKHIATRFSDRGIEFEDLIQIGTIGLIKALDGFDESLGYSFSTYAFPMICGEIKKALRDDGIIKVSRKVKKNARDISAAREKYIREYKKEPSIEQLAYTCNLKTEDIIDAIEASSPVISLEEKIYSDETDLSFMDTLTYDDGTNDITDKLTLYGEISNLPSFEKRLINLRYFKNMTQTQTAKVLGVSQVKISRTEAKIINKFRAAFL